MTTVSSTTVTIGTYSSDGVRATVSEPLVQMRDSEGIPIESSLLENLTIQSTGSLDTPSLDSSRGNPPRTDGHHRGYRWTNTADINLQWSWIL